MSDSSNAARLRVRVWFGAYSIADYTGEDMYARRYAAAMQPRFPSLRVSTEPLPGKLVRR